MNPYEVLQVSHNADAEVIRAAYRSLIQRFHPDRQPNNPQMAERVAQITRAYDLLSDPQRRAEYDSLRRRTDAEQRLAPQRHASSRHQSSTRSFDLSNFSLIPRASWLLIALGFLIIAWGAGLGVKTFGSVYVSPVTELSQLRTRIESPVTNESEKRQMYARKQTILQASPELSLKDNQLRLDDLAGRSVSLLKAAISEDFVVRLSGNSATITVVIPEITLVLGSFDAQQLSEQINKHRKQIVENLRVALDKPPVLWPISADSEARLKALILESVMNSLELRSDEAFPTTYFESPGRYGVIQVLLPQSFARIR